MIELVNLTCNWSRVAEVPDRVNEWWVSYGSKQENKCDHILNELVERAGCL